MKLYRMELYKILRKKFTWIASILLLGVISVSFYKEMNGAQNVIMDFGTLAGYRRFLDLLQFFCVYLSIWLMVVFAPLFCEDKQYKVDVLLSTTVNGKMKDFLARVQVIVTMTIVLLFLIVFITYLICGNIYGYSGGDSLLKDIYLESDLSVAAGKTIVSFTKYYLINTVSAFILLDTIIIWVSTMNKKAVYALLAVFAVILLPVMLEGTLHRGGNGIVYTIITGQPILLMTLRCFKESWHVFGWHMLLVYAFSLIGVRSSAKKWCSPVWIF